MDPREQIIQAQRYLGFLLWRVLERAHDGWSEGCWFKALVVDVDLAMVAQEPQDVSTALP